MAKSTLKDVSHELFKKLNLRNSDWAVRNVNIDWNDGGAYALLGPSGCGKTTLLNIISGLINPTQGDILFDDKTITSPKSSREKHCANFSIPSHLRYYDGC